jgi:hypothetical protein
MTSYASLRWDIQLLNFQLLQAHHVDNVDTGVRYE